jgi:hypothetical protein
MSTQKATSIYDGTRYLYAEQLKGKRVTLTIKAVTGGVEFFDARGSKTVGFDITFEGTDKVYGLTGITVRRQLFMATGTEDPSQMGGKAITLYPIKSAKSATGQAIRIAVPEHMA